MHSSLGHINSLTSIRIFAALLVVLSHLKLAKLTSYTWLSWIDNMVFWNGFAGVAVFFVLSGFVMSYANQQWRGNATYLINRVARIYPTHFLLTFPVALGLLFLSLKSTGFAWENYLPKLLLNLSLFHAFIPSADYYFSFNAVTWSLSVEVFFYICFIFLRKWSNKQLVFFFCGLLLLKLLAELVSAIKGWQDMQHWLFYIFPIARLPEFLGGMLLYRYLGLHSLKGRFMNPLGLIILMLLTMALIKKLAGEHCPFLFSTIPLFFSLFIVAAAVGQVNSYLNNKWLILLGHASFALYLIHLPLLYFYREGARFLGIELSLVVTLLVGFIALVGAVFYYRYIEVPLTTFCRRTLMSLTKKQFWNFKQLAERH